MLLQAKPSLADQSVILVFVIGGINGIEVSFFITKVTSHSRCRAIFFITVYVSSIVKVLEAQEAVSESGRPDINLVIGGTTLLTPDDMFELLLGQFSHF